MGLSMASTIEQRLEHYRQSLSKLDRQALANCMMVRALAANRLSMTQVSMENMIDILVEHAESVLAEVHDTQAVDE